MRKGRRFILLVAIFVSLGGVAYKVVETVVASKAREIRQNPLKALDYLPESALRIKEFHRAKIEDGQKVWELFGEEASYSKEQKEAVIKKPRFSYYDKKGETIHTKGDEAHLIFADKELDRMRLQGGIEVSFQGFVLKSQEAVYHPAKDQIVMPGKVTLVGEGLELEGSSMEVELKDQRVRLLSNVKTKLEPDKLAKKKTKSSKS